jgi:HK97 family phage portal protein
MMILGPGIDTYKAATMSPASAEWVSATVRTQDATLRYTNTEARQLLALVTQYAEICARINASTVGSLTMRLYKPAGSGRKRYEFPTQRVKAKSLRVANRRMTKAIDGGMDAVEEVTDHPVLTLLSKPNPWCYSASELIEQVVYSLEMTGNAFLFSGTDVAPADLYTMAPQYVRITPDPDRFIAAYIYGRSAEVEVSIDPAMVGHVRLFPNLDSPYLGRGCLHAVVREAELQALATQNEISRWLNAGRPSMWLPVRDGITQDEMRAVKASIASEYRGTHNAGKMLVTNALAGKPESLEFNPAEMEYVKGQEMIAERIWNAFGVPQSLLKLNDANLASAASGNRQYAELTILPRAQKIAETLTEWLLPMFGLEGYWLAFDSPVKGDERATEARAQSLVSTGVMTINELRAELGYEPLDGGDVLRINGMPLDRPQTTAPAGLGTDPSTAPTEGTVDIAANLARALPPQTCVPGTSSAQPQHTEDQSQTKAACHAPSTGTEPEPSGPRCKSSGTTPIPEASCQHRSVNDCACGCGNTITKDDDDDLRLLNKLANAMQQAIGGDIRNMAEEAIDSATAAGGVSISPSAINALAAAMYQEVSNSLAEGARRGLAAIASSAGTAEEPGDAFSVIPENALSFYRERTPKLAGDVAGGLAANVKQAITTGLAEGKNLEEIKADLRKLVPEMSATRAEVIARTETSYALNLGEKYAWADAGITHVRWKLAGGPCPICEKIAEEYPGPHPIDESFYDLGDTVTTSKGVFVFDYRPVYSPPAHPQCRCTLLPADSEDES